MTDVAKPEAAAPINPSAPLIWVTHMPYRKGGSPVIAGFGSTIRAVVIMDLNTWTQLSNEIPELERKQFKVGTFE